MDSPYEIRLIVHPQADGHRAAWTSLQGQLSEEFPLTLPLQPEDMAELRWYLETYIQFPGAGDRARAQRLEARLVEWGKNLFDALFGTAEGVQVYNDLMNAAAPRLLTLGSSDPTVLAQPWEMLRDRRGKSSPLVFQDVIVRRQLQGAKLRKSKPLGLPLRVLLIVSRPTDSGFIDPRNSIAPLLEVVDDLPAGLVRLDFCEPPTLKELERRVAQARRTQQPYHIVHFDGHGTYLAKTGVGALAFEREDATTHLVTGVQVGDLLARLDVPLVLLEACRGADLSDKAVFGSVAPALLESGVSSVVAFSHAVHVQAARLLVERFYQELAAGLSVGQALAEARVALHSDPARWLHLGPNADSVDLQDWFIPQLYQVGLDPVLLAVPSPLTPLPQGARGTPTPSPLEGEGRGEGENKLHHFPPPPLYRFHGRAQELLDLERAFRRYPAVVLHAMGGMGKTALAREAAFWWLRTGRSERAVFSSFEQQAGIERAIQIFGQALEGESFSARSPEDQWRTAVDGFRQQGVLWVWDNFESTLPQFQADEDPDSPLVFSATERNRLLVLYRELTAGNPRGRLLITCRPEETGLPGIKELPLAGLARPDSLYLLAAVLDQKSIAINRPGYEREEIDDLLNALDDHPLSIELVAPHLRHLTPLQIREDFGKLVAQFANGDAFEQRNSSLLASLIFSTRRLSANAQAVLPYLAWFQGGVFEQFLLAFTELDAAAWETVRAELVATALLKVEHLPQFNTPYLRFHPTLPYAARPETVLDPAAAEQRFIAVYGGVKATADQCLYGRQPAAGMVLVEREEANLRAAVRQAFRRGERQAAWSMADTLREYLQRAGRQRERDALVAWVRAQLPATAGLDHATWATTLQHAWSRFTQGQAAEAVQMVQNLIDRLEREGLADGSDPAFQLVTSYFYLGRIYGNAGRSDLALEPLQQAIAGLERLGEAWQGNLSTALGDLANAQRNLGRLDAALATAERGLAIDRALGRDRDVATGLGQIASILMDQQRYAEAETRYDEALRAARAAGDLELQGGLLQHQGILQGKLGRYDQAVERYQQALQLFQRADDLGSEMRTCDLLATAERNRGQLDAAEAWYRRSRELAERLQDKTHLATVAQNLSILYQTRAEQTDDPARRTDLLRQAVASVQQSLSGWLEQKNQVNTAASYLQLGILHRLLGELEQAEQYALQGLQIHESLDLPDVYKDYYNLAIIARDRGDSEAAARWQAKYDAKLAELERRRRGDGSTGL
ncbi:MAG: tetratricopeptide repeat protein [Candidatus Competibacteraceae bacterium]